MGAARLKILQLVPAMDQGGVERGVVEMNRVLVGAGHENIVLSAGGRLDAQIAADGGRVITLDVKSKNPFTAFSRARKLRRFLEAERPDVTVAHSRVPAWLFLFANRKLRLPWITFAHGANSVSAYSKVMTYGDVTVTPSGYIADYLIENYGIEKSRLRVIPRAIEREKFDPEKLDGTFTAAKRREWGLDGFKVVMGLGRITQLKGYDVLIRALAYLHKTHAAARSQSRDWKLVIVGEAEELRKDYEAARKLAEEQARLEKEEEKQRKEQARLERARRAEEEKNRKKSGKKDVEPDQEGVNKEDSREGLRAYARGRAYIPGRFDGVTEYVDPNTLPPVDKKAARKEQAKQETEKKPITEKVDLSALNKKKEEPASAKPEAAEDKESV